MAAVCKQVWNIASKKDTSWVRWINAVYLKGDNFWDHNAKADSAWYWRKLNKIKLKIPNLIEGDKWKPSKKGIFSISSCYKALQNNTNQMKEAKWIWGKYHIPKTNFIHWLPHSSENEQNVSETISTHLYTV